MSPAKSMSRKETQAQLGISKGSRAIPIVLVLVSIVLFLSALPQKYDHEMWGLGENPTSAQLLEKAGEIFTGKNAAGMERLRGKIDKNIWVLAKDIIRPLFKAYLEQLATDFVEISKNLVATVVTLALYALIPGVAGMIYRRNFALWFLVAFGLLLVINASGLFGSLTPAGKQMPYSGAILFFLLSQLIVLILALRLQRHSVGMKMLPPRLYNWGLKALLMLAAIGIYQFWDTGNSQTGAAGKDGVAEQTRYIEPVSPVAAYGDVGLFGLPLVRVEGGSFIMGGYPSRITRGGSIWNSQTLQRSSSRDTSFPNGREINGFRLAQEEGKTAPGKRFDPQKQKPGEIEEKSSLNLSKGFLGWVYKWEFILIGLPLIYTLLRSSASWTARKQKNIVICLDGTSNTPDQIEMGFAAQTNVFKLFKMLKVDKRGGYVPVGEFDASLCKKYDGRQIAFYYAGVGNKYDSDPILQTLGMATGMGAAEIVERAYLDLVRVYQPGDRIFITGFSRGAAIARLLARAIDARGAPRSVWTLKLFGKHRTLSTSSKKKNIIIDVLGCWDTVGAFGVAKTIAGINFQKLNAFKDLTIPDNVAQAYHMVALDEQRDSFEPTLMDPDPIRPERIVEVWFSGDHANIGGGWATDRLSDITLDFLLRRVSSGYATMENTLPGEDESWGLYLTAQKCHKGEVADRANANGYEIDNVAAVDPDPLGQVRQWFSNLYTYRPRTLPLHAVISETVFQRMTGSMPVYAPQALFNLNDALDRKRDLIDEKVAKLAETNSLDENERQQVIAFKEKLRLMRWPKYWANVVATRKPQKVEDVLKNADGVAVEQKGSA